MEARKTDCSASAISIPNDLAKTLVTTDKIRGIQGGECGCKNSISAKMYREREVVNPDEIEIGLED